MKEKQKRTGIKEKYKLSFLRASIILASGRLLAIFNDLNKNPEIRPLPEKLEFVLITVFFMVNLIAIAREVHFLAVEFLKSLNQMLGKLVRYLHKRLTVQPDLPLPNIERLELRENLMNEVDPQLAINSIEARKKV